MSEGRGSRAQEILETATRLFAGRGYDGVSVRDICAELDLNSSVISYYFQGKRGLYLEVLRRQFAAYGRVLAEIAASGPRMRPSSAEERSDGRLSSGNRLLSPPTFRTPREQLADLGRAMRTFQQEYPYFSILTARESGCPSPEYLQVQREYEAEHGNALTELIENGQRQGSFRRGPRAEYLALILTLLFNGAAAARTFSADSPPERVEADYFEAVGSLIADGLLTDPEAEDSSRRLGKQSAKPRGTWG